MTYGSVDELLARARSRIDRVRPADLEHRHAEGALVVDIRPERQRAEEGELGFGLIVDRNVLEWRLEPHGADVVPEVRDFDQPVIVVCSEGYASSLAASSLRELGFSRAADLDGGYVAWRRWRDAQGPPTSGS